MSAGGGFEIRIVREAAGAPQRRSKTSAVARRAARLVGLACTILLAPGAASPDPERQTIQEKRYWWEIWESARKVIEDQSSDFAALTTALTDLDSAIRQMPEECLCPPPSLLAGAEVLYLPYLYSAWAYVRIGEYEKAQKMVEKSDAKGYLVDARDDEARPHQERLRWLRGLIPEGVRAKKLIIDAGKISVACTGAIEGVRAASHSLQEILKNPKGAEAVKQGADRLDAALGRCNEELSQQRRQTDVGAQSPFVDFLSVPGVKGRLGASSKRVEEFLASRSVPGAATTSEKVKKLKELCSQVRVELNDSARRSAESASSLLEREAAFLEVDDGGAELRRRARVVRAAPLESEDADSLREFLDLVVRLESELRDVDARIRTARKGRRERLQQIVGDLTSPDEEARCLRDRLGIEPLREPAIIQAQDLLKASEPAVALLDAAVAEARKLQERIAKARGDLRASTDGSFTRAKATLQRILNSGSVVSKCENPQSLLNSLAQLRARQSVCLLVAQSEDVTERCAPELEVRRQELVEKAQAHLARARDLKERLSEFGDPGLARAVGVASDDVQRLLPGYDFDATLSALTTLTEANKRFESQVGVVIQGWLDREGEAEKGSCWGRLEAQRRDAVESAANALRKSLLADLAAAALFLREFPRLEAETELACAFEAVLSRGDVEEAVRHVRQLGEERLKECALLAYSLAYFHWTKAAHAGDGEREGILKKAAEALDGLNRRAEDAAVLDDRLFSPDFLEWLRDRSGASSG